KGMIKVLDCPQVHPRFLSDLLSRGADGLGVERPPDFDSPDLAARKAEEYELADLILVLSDIHHRSFVQAGFSPDRLVQIPLWVDPELWFPPPQTGDGRQASNETSLVTRHLSRTNPLKVLFVGSIGLRKGIPYLMRAV